MSTRLFQVVSVIRAWLTLLYFDYRHWRRRPALDAPSTACHRGEVDRERLRKLMRAFEIAMCLYWRRVRCLQHAICLTRFLRAYALPARYVIGYRPRPFVAHAWVEVDGEAVEGSQGYPTRLQRLLVS